MEKKTIYSSFEIANRVWIYTVLVFSSGAGIFFVAEDFSYGSFLNSMGAFVASFICAAIGSLPALLLINFFTSSIQLLRVNTQIKLRVFVAGNLFITSLYGVAAGLITTSAGYDTDYWTDFFETTGIATGLLFAAACIAVFINRRAIHLYFSRDKHNSFSQQFFTQLNTSNMEQQAQTIYETKPFSTKKGQNKALIKAGITAMLILLMLIPTSFIQNLITERKERQEQIVTEVSNKWASAQTLTTPYIVVPYYTDSLSKINKNNIVLLPDNLSLKSNIIPVERARSIYNVLLYKSDIDISGNFHFTLPKDIAGANFLLNEARLCTGISDFKGIEEQVTVHINNTATAMTPGLPVHIDSNGLSAPLALAAADLSNNMPFHIILHIKGSRQLHFIPLSTSSNFEVQSSWHNPSFDGNVIPTDKTVSNEKPGFNARWSFNSANLPFTNVLLGNDIKSYNQLAFGVSLVQPADQYVKTMRSVKYAVFIIGLTFALFFIIELLQRRPVHPVQYVLVGLALVIFYSLLVSISEFILFAYAYSIAAAATVVLITLYTKSHFRTWKTAGIFFCVLAGLYAFIYILISLEDTALLVGSIALFTVLAITMYASRKINWYQPSLSTADVEALQQPV